MEIRFMLEVVFDFGCKNKVIAPISTNYGPVINAMASDTRFLTFSSPIKYTPKFEAQQQRNPFVDSCLYNREGNYKHSCCRRIDSCNLAALM